MRYTLIAILSGLCFLTSCTVDEGTDIFDIPQTGYTLFEADFEDVCIEGYQPALWDRKKCIGVIGSKSRTNEKYVLKKAFDGKPVGEFYGALVEGDRIMAYCPYSEDFDPDGGMTYTLDPNQSYVQGTTVLEQFYKYAGRYMYAFSSSDNKLRFSYASGVLAVRIGYPEVFRVTGLELVSEDAGIAGTGMVESDMTVSFGDGKLTRVVLQCEDAIDSKAEDGALTIFPIVLPSGKYEGVKLVIETADRDDVIYDLDSFEIRPVTAGDYTVTEVVIAGGLGGFEIERGLEFE